MIALLLTGLGILALALLFYLSMVFPQTLQGWADREQALSGFERLLAQLSQLTVMLAPVLFPLAGLWVLGCVIWAVISFVGSKNKG